MIVCNYLITPCEVYLKPSSDVSKYLAMNMHLVSSLTEEK